MAYNLFLFDLDDTLLDFKESEKLAFKLTIENLGLKNPAVTFFSDYQNINNALWKAFELGITSQATLKSERFKQLFEKHKIELDPVNAGKRYLEVLAETVVVVDQALEICEWLSKRGEIGIITNGIQETQMRRLVLAKLQPLISFVAVSEASGFAKPDVRFFEYSVKLAKKFAKADAIMIGDRLETDILGAHNFGIDSVWFNPSGLPIGKNKPAKHTIKHLAELRKIL